MKIVVFGDEKRVGALLDDMIVDLNKANAALPSGLEAFISAGAQAIAAAQGAIAKADRSALIDPCQRQAARALGGQAAGHGGW